jgi:hypothetical protein
MISAFVSRDSGFGLPVREDQLQLINAYRQGKQYVDKAAALEILKTVEKPPLTELPFVRSLLIGASKGGYWNSFHKTLQFEDTVDCLKILNPELDLVFLFTIVKDTQERKMEHSMQTTCLAVWWSTV